MGSRQRQRVSVTIRLPRDLAQRLRTFARDNAGRPLFCTVSGIAEAGIAAHLDKLEARLRGDDLAPAPSTNGTRA